MDSRGAGGARRYRERLYLSWWGWPLPLLAAALLAVEIHMGYPVIPEWLPFVVLMPAMVAWLWSMGRAKLTVTDEELVVGKARLPLRFAGDVDVIPPEHKRKAMGPELDPAAYALHRGWVKPMVRVRLTDPEDPTPYWIFSTRRPEKVAELLRTR